ncbi:MAG: hypothetical protein JWP74_3981 [Marmoricola sp.]|nr:hypothetical protein [Marmoricola sp.]
MSEPRATLMEDGDAFMLHLESPNITFLYLNGWILDTTACGRPVTLDQIVAVAPTYLGVALRLTQRVELVPRSDQRCLRHCSGDRRAVDPDRGSSSRSADQVGPRCSRHAEAARPDQGVRAR